VPGSGGRQFWDDSVDRLDDHLREIQKGNQLTEMVFRQAGDFGDFTDEQYDGLSAGYSQFFDRLAESVERA
jgi:2'-5' RNA ligase